MRLLLLSLFLCCAAGASAAPVPLAGAAIVHDGSPTMRLASAMLRRDLEAVSGQASPELASVDACPAVCIVIGSADAVLMRRLARDEGLDLHGLERQWERYKRLIVAPRRKPGVRLVVIAGSDLRGAVYGAVDLTRELGVSAWEWWADVRPARRADVSIADAPLFSKPPSVRYRGIFLNDEDWGLQPWAARRDPTRDIGPTTYARIFELMWRLKANIVWPAMHDVTKPFYTIAGNAETARDYAIVVGTSHAEPMMRNNVREWDKARGAFNFFTNRDALVRYWGERVEEVKGFENMYSVGIRGVHDSAMEGAATMAQARQGMQEVITIQRDLLSQALGQPAARVPQALTLYKEVLDIYQAGLRVPDDVTLIWPDDNYGYLHQLSTPAEARRAGGTGLYYHLSYWGRPHDYLWLGTTHPALIREQLQRALATGTRRVWIANVGDIKPLEYLSQYFLDAAFDAGTLSRPPSQHRHAWFAAQFGAEHAGALSALMGEFYDLAWERRPEFMGFSQTEPTTPTRQTDYLQAGGEEAELRWRRYAALAARAEELEARLPADLRDAYFQLVLYPIRAAANLNARILQLDLAAQYARMGRPAAHRYAAQARAAQQAIPDDTAHYNALADGKWQGMMDAAPRRLPVFQTPLFPEYPDPPQRECALAYPSLSAAVHFTRGVAETKALTLFRPGSVPTAWRIKSAPPGLRIAPGSGQLVEANGYEQRIELRYDGGEVAGPLALQCGERTLNVALRLGASHERERIVTLKPADAAIGKGWTLVPELGSTGSSLRSDLDLPSARQAGGPLVSYTFTTESDGRAQLRFVGLPVHALTSTHRVRLGYSLDGGPLRLLDFATVGRSDEWKANVLSNTAVRSVTLEAVKPGRHRLQVYALDPGVILDRIELRFDGAPAYYGKQPMAY